MKKSVSLLSLEVISQHEQGKCILILTQSNAQSIQESLIYPEHLVGLVHQWRLLYEQGHDIKSRAIELDAEFDGDGSEWDCNYDIQQLEAEILKEFNQWLYHSRILHNIQNELILNEYLFKEKNTFKNESIHLLISSRDMILSKFPWEEWSFFPEDELNKRIKVIRTISTERSSITKINTSKKKYKALIILGNEPILNMDRDETILKKLRKIAHIDFLKFSDDLESGECKGIIKTKLQDHEWDFLFFSGHTQESSRGGIIQCQYNIKLDLKDLEDALKQSIKNGLKFAFFNSCQGISIAEYLIALGLPQVLVMREKIHTDSAYTFLSNFIESFVKHKDVYACFENARLSLKRNIISDPSAFLTPSLFTHPECRDSFFYVPSGFIKNTVHTYRPQTKLEFAMLSLVLLSSIAFPLQYLFIDLRLGVQAIAKIVIPNSKQVEESPIQLITIDQDSIDQANSDPRYKLFSNSPIERRYLTDIISKLQSIGSPVIGIDYLLSEQTEHDDKLKAAFNTKNHQSWFVLSSSGRQKYPLTIFQESQWVIQSDGDFYNWEMNIPKSLDCDDGCPFSFVLVNAFESQKNITSNETSNHLNTEIKKNNEANLKREVEGYYFNSKNKIPDTFGISLTSNTRMSVFKQVIQFLNSTLAPYSLINYSIPPYDAYEEISAKDFLDSGVTAEFKEQYQNRIVIISGGDYKEVIDNQYSRPLAMDIWCGIQDRYLASQVGRCDRLLTSGEIQAYTAYHYLKGQNLKQISFFWTTMFAIILGKIIQVYAFSLDRSSRQNFKDKLTWRIGAGGIINLLIFMIFNLSIPFVIPAIIVLSYMQSSLRSQNVYE